MRILGVSERIVNFAIQIRNFKKKTYAYTADHFGMRFYFYLDEHEPIHVHINANGKKAKIALEPEVSVVYNHGLKEQE